MKSDIVQETTDSTRISDDVKDVKAHKMQKEDVIGFLILIILYTIQGIPMGFFGRTMSVLFLENGAHSSDLAVLSLSSIPYSFKFLIAPFIDTHYFRFLGKRKTYIVPMQYLFALICFSLSSSLDESMKSLNVTRGFLFGITSMTLMAIQDIAVDGWVMTILSPENRAYGSLAQTLGLTFGGVISLNILIPLSSIKFCNNYIYQIPRDKPLLSVEDFWFYTGLITLVVTILIHIFKKEKRDESIEEKTSVWEVIKTLKIFITNPNLRQLISIILTGSITIAPVYALFDTKLMRKGFPKETLTNISTVLIPFQMAYSVVIGKLCQKKLEMKVKFWCTAIAHLNCLFLLWIATRFNKETNYEQTMYFVVLGNVIAVATFYGNFISNGSYSSRICDESIGGTFLTTLAAFSNLGYTIAESASLYINEYVSWEYMGIFSLVAGPLYLIWYRKQTNELSNKAIEDFTTMTANDKED